MALDGQKIVTEIYLNMDLNDDCMVTKNEWIIAHVKLLEKNYDLLKRKGPDSIMNYITELSDEFDKYDTDGNKMLELQEFKEMLRDAVHIYE